MESTTATNSTGRDILIDGKGNIMESKESKRGWAENLKDYKDAISRVLAILKDEGYLGDKTIKDYETIKAFPNLIEDLLSKARAEGQNEGREEIIAGANGFPVMLLAKWNQDLQEEARLQRDKEIIEMIDGMKEAQQGENVKPLPPMAVGWNGALDTLKSKLK